MQQIDEQPIKREMYRTQMDVLPLVALTVGLLFWVYAFFQSVLLRENNYGLMVAIAIVSGLLLLALWFVLDKISLPEEWTNLIYGVMALLVLFSMLIRLVFDAQPHQTGNLVLFLLGVGAFFVSRRWFVGIVAVTLLSWMGIAWWLLLPQLAQPELQQGAIRDWRFQAILLLAAASAAVVLHMSRVQALRRLIELQITESQQRRELEHRTTQLETNVAVGQRITSLLEPQKLLPQVARLIQTRFRLQYVGVYLPRESLVPDQLTAVAESGNRVATAVSTHSWQSLLQQAYLAGVTRRIETPSPQTAVVEPTVSLLLPLKMGDDMLGMLALQANGRSALPAKDNNVFELLADQVTIALENAQLYGQIKQFNSQLEVKVAERTAALQQAYAQLERLNKTKTDFLTIASHELKTPLTLINFYGQLFSDEKELATHDTYGKWIRHIQQGTGRLEGIVERMLDVAKIDSQSLDLYVAPLSLHFLLTTLNGRFQNELAARQLTLTLDGLNKLPQIEADVEALEKVFYQLLVNAIKYTPDGGEIVVNGRFRPNHILPNAITDCVEIVVADTGVGISAAAQELIFDKFFQTGEVTLHSSGKTSFKGGGSGLGLTIAKGVVLAHHGDIWVESDGHDEQTLPGSQFYVVLPIRQPDSA